MKIGDFVRVAEGKGQIIARMVSVKGKKVTPSVPPRWFIEGQHFSGFYAEDAILPPETEDERDDREYREAVFEQGV